MAPTTPHTLWASIALLLLASQTVNADFYRLLPPPIPKPTPSPSPRLPVPHYPSPSSPPSPEPETPTPVPRQTSSMAEEFMAPQNAVREKLGLQPFMWDNKLQSYAEWWANQRRSDCALIHSTGPYGENLFWGSGTGWTPTEAAESWTVEAKDYSYISNSCVGGMCGHYTQIVWRDTKFIGCARVICDNGLGVFMGCSYNPPGNYVGEKPY